jgi:hypothetical protein
LSGYTAGVSHRNQIALKYAANPTRNVILRLVCDFIIC